ncbi:MAG: sterol desaturase family protein [Crocinitomicaceae bacterium]|nr:sterol desaturase family protein [Crocinitomicaceae bacterium]
MEMMGSLIAVGSSLIFLMWVFTPLEKAFPAKKNQKIFRQHWLLDLTYCIGQYLLLGSLVLLVLSKFSIVLVGIIPAGFRELVSSQPFWLQLIEVVILSDVLIYWGHRLQHRVGFLWRFHKVHHSAKHLDWLAAYREHPLDSIYTIGLINLPAFILGFDLGALAGLIAFRGIWAIYIHSNVRMNFTPIKWLIGAPQLHHWHHYLDRDAGNYANISPLMDLIFGTYICPDHEPEEFGIREEFPQNYVGQMIHPLLPYRVAEKLGHLKLPHELKESYGDDHEILDQPILIKSVQTERQEQNKGVQ